MIKIRKKLNEKQEGWIGGLTFAIGLTLFIIVIWFGISFLRLCSAIIAIPTEDFTVKLGTMFTIIVGLYFWLIHKILALAFEFMKTGIEIYKGKNAKKTTNSTNNR